MVSKSVPSNGLKYLLIIFEVLEWFDLSYLRLDIGVFVNTMHWCCRLQERVKKQFPLIECINWFSILPKSIEAQQPYYYQYVRHFVASNKFLAFVPPSWIPNSHYPINANLKLVLSLSRRLSLGSHLDDIRALVFTRVVELYVVDYQPAREIRGKIGEQYPKAILY